MSAWCQRRERKASPDDERKEASSNEQLREKSLSRSTQALPSLALTDDFLPASVCLCLFPCGDAGCVSETLAWLAMLDCASEEETAGCGSAETTSDHEEGPAGKVLW
mmetsp:Transcript_47460/g.93575  ORF Transcript_47460/g.93575 Transcript_47460/m.93575 type:complete len:107 (-) Transcript_47460:184-504(-)